jgi:sugar fermentation stimulation protein A
LKYDNVEEAIFLERPNRFIAYVELNGKIEKVHVKNTGRCKEILVKGAKVYLEKSNNPNRKTKWSVISAYKGKNIINIDSQIPNKVFYEGVNNNLIKINELEKLKLLKSEKTFKNSRFDFYYETDKNKGYIEIKGVTLEENGVCMFPDAPTERGARHVNELIESIKYGFNPILVFIVQMKNCNIFKSNFLTDSTFSYAVKKAKEKGVKIYAIDCKVTFDSIKADKFIELDI